MTRRSLSIVALAVFLVFGLIACGTAETPTPTLEPRVYDKPQTTPAPTPTPVIIDPRCLVPEYNSDKTEVRSPCGGGFVLILSKCSFSDTVLGVIQAGSSWISIPEGATVEFYYFRYDAELRAKQLKADGYYVMPDSRWIFDTGQYTE